MTLSDEAIEAGDHGSIFVALAVPSADGAAGGDRVLWVLALEGASGEARWQFRSDAAANIEPPRLAAVGGVGAFWANRRCHS